ncbi:Ubiquinone biosynthesis O-methyltransferase [Caloramator mitchellensis]|uniref:Ubiquinone biosynthesis O-methyltransferase n=1 Tax=Caloramator mitchellensis TaxID=908809 RepID=A0A0R3JZ77_CALMK|nr:class I SAM-dependent methyltransferase [Caloramator mitchellensis]KRQ86452.1 Ubiquinone biosynthesis O-methyltransferase [Caloramator mitchellensis]
MDSIKYYDENAIEFFNNTAYVDMGETYDRFLKYLKRGDHILDAGCGSGRDTKYFIEKGFKVTAIDASEEMVKLSSNFTGHQTIKMDFNEIDFENEFDAIWACASILHVPKNEIKDILFKFAKALNDNGILFASFKYGEGEQFRNGRLFNYYNEDSLTKTLNEIGIYDILEIWKSSDVRKERENEIWISVILKEKKM